MLLVSQNATVNWFKSYFSNRSFKVNLGNNFSQPASVSCGVPQGSILGPLLFLIYLNDMSQAVKCHQLMYADDSCLVCQHKDIYEIEKQLNVDFSNICNWFMDNKFVSTFVRIIQYQYSLLLNLKIKILKNLTQNMRKYKSNNILR